MKRFAVAFLTLLLLVSFTGCYEKNPEYKMPLNCYYPNSVIAYNAETSVIGCEQKEGAYLANQSFDLFLCDYLKGPQKESLVSPFPEGTTLEYFSIEEQTVYLYLSQEFGALTGHNFTLACACITLTVLDYTGLTYVKINVTGNSPEESKSITMDREGLILADPAVGVS